MVQANIGNVLVHPAYAAMRARAQWFVYRLRPHKKKPRKLEKVPVALLDGARLLDLHARANWVTVEVAVAAALQLGAQAAATGRDESFTVGFCITTDDDINLVDLDKAYDGNAWSAFSREVFALLPGAPFEVSVGLDGMHILPCARVAAGHGVDRPDGMLEVYSAARGVALTGISAQGDPGKDYSSELARLIAEHIPAAASASRGPRVAPSLDEWNAKTEAEQGATLDDLRSALTYISAESRGTWVDAGFALRGGLPEEHGFDLWEEWSRTAASFSEEGLSQWGTFNPMQTSYKSIFVKAEAAGWTNPRRQQPLSIPAGMFGAEEAKIVGESRPATTGGYSIEEALVRTGVPASKKLPAELSMVQACFLPADISIRFDRFIGDAVVHWHELRNCSVPRPLEEDDYLFMRRHFESRWNFKAIGKDLMADAVRLEARSNEFDSAIEWLNGLPQWDGVPRVEHFVTQYLSAKAPPATDDEDGASKWDAYARAVGNYYWSAATGRILVPGVKADAVPVLVGAGGLKKSSILEALAPTEETFGELSLAASREDRIRLMRGKLIVELAELAGMNKREGEEVKAFVTSRFDEFVDKFERIARRHPRRCMFLGSTNEQNFLSDPTGNRRWLPIEAGGVIDVELIRRDRDQLWAEGAHLFRANGVMYQGLEGVAADRAAAHTAADPWDDSVGTWLAAQTRLVSEAQAAGKDPAKMGSPLEFTAKGEPVVTAARVLEYAVGLAKSQANAALVRRVGHCIRRAGWDSRTVRLPNTDSPVHRFARDCGAA
jgi:hypothetical protein